MKHLQTSLAALAMTAGLAVAAQAQTSEPAAPQPEAQAQQQQGQITAETVREQPVYSTTGAEAGRIVGVAVNQGGEHFIVVAFNERLGNRQAAVPAANLAQQNGRFVIVQLSDAQLGQLPAYQEGQNGMRAAEAATPLRLGAVQAAGEGAQIVVQQQAPAIRVTPSEPQVTVEQATPSVSVVQPEPEIVVRQAPPTISISMPQPEITVRMPDPDVNVAMAEPRVQVRVPEPQVQVLQPEQPELNMAPAGKANVAVTPPASRAEVNIQRGTPKVRVEPMGQPRVVFNQAEGQPQIRFERMGEAQVGAVDQQGGAAPLPGAVAQDQAAEQAPATPPGTQATTPAPGATATAPPAQPGAVAPGADSGSSELTTGTTDPTAQPGTGETAGAAARLLPMQASQLRGTDVYNRRGNNLGEVADVLIDSNNQVHLIVEYGGFLGIGEQRVMLPLDRFAMQGSDRLVIPGMTEDQLRAQTAWTGDMNGYRAAENDYRTNINPLD